MTKQILKKSPDVKRIPHSTDKLLSEMMPDARSIVRAASRDLLTPRKEAVEALLLKAAAKNW